MRSVIIKSAFDGSFLELSEFRSEYPGAESELFLVTAHLQNCSASLQASTFMTVALADFFKDIAANWRGWSGKKEWSTLEGELSFTATSDSTGHINLCFSLSPPCTGHEWQLKGSLMLEAGSLDNIANNVSMAWSNAKT